MSVAHRLDRIWYRPNPYQWLLWPLGLIYRLLSDIRRYMYRRGFRTVTRLPVPVIVVGNLTVGGTGKTPLVIWIAEGLVERGYRVGIVSRGYGGRAAVWPQPVDASSDPALVGDEPVLLARATGCPVSVGPNRVEAAQALLEREPVDVLVADDGLQHHALGRVMEIVVVDGERGFGNGLGLPAGPMRERASRLEQVDAVVVNGGDRDVPGGAGEVSRLAGEMSRLAGELSRLAGELFRSRPQAKEVVRLDGSGRKPLDSFRGVSVHAVAAIGHPARFFRLLEAAGVRVAAHPLPDHAAIGDEDLHFDDSNTVLITEKDAVKCRHLARDDLWYVPIKLTFESEAGDRLMALAMRRIEECRWISP